MTATLRISAASLGVVLCLVSGCGSDGKSDAEKAREKGSVAKSVDVNGVAVLGVATLAVIAIATVLPSWLSTTGMSLPEKPRPWISTSTVSELRTKAKSSTFSPSTAKSGRTS